MDGSNTLYYHSHISRNIDKVQERKQSYIKHRKDFLKEHCSPIQQKIEDLEKQISFYSHLIQNQNQMIQNEEQVSQLKNEIQQFQKTQTYFLTHINQYQSKILQLTIENSVIQQQINKLKNSLTNLAHHKTHKVYLQLNSQIRDQHQSTITNTNNRSRLLNNSRASHNPSMNSSTCPTQTQPFTVLLPTIFKVEKYYVNKETSIIHRKVEQYIQGNNRNLSAAEKLDKKTPSQIHKECKLLANNKSHTTPIPIMQQQPSIYQKSTSVSPKLQITKKQQQLRKKFKQITTSFNNFQVLFKQCFEKKRNQVQKCVSQLQSKLISDRQKFLQVCQAVGQRDLKQISFQQFEALTGDQLMTLFISFPWIHKRIFKQLNERRKIIIQLQTHKFL